MAATRMAQGRPRIGHNDQRSVLARCPAASARSRMSVVSFEDSDVVRSAIRVEGFRDDEFNYQLIRALGVADYGGSTVGECLAVAAEITDGSPAELGPGVRRSWPDRVEDRGRACLEAGHRVSGRDHYFRASTYYRTAEYYADAASRAVAADRGAESGVLRRGRRICSTRRSSWSTCPSTGERSPATSCGRQRRIGVPPRAAPDPDRRGRLRLQCRGALLPPRGAGGRAGMECLRLRRARSARLHAPRPDADLPARLRGADRRGPRRVGGPDDVDADRLALAGQSFGSYFAARSAATDHRVRALVANPPVVDMSRYMEAWVGPTCSG